MDYRKVVDRIKWTFLNEHKFILKKYIEEFKKDDEYFADYYNFWMVEDNGDKPPTIFHVASPFDTISKKDPQHALVWNDGKVILNIEYADYAAMRTGAMDAIVLEVSGVKSLIGKKILILGTGRTAKWSVKVTKEIFKDFSEIAYINSTNTSDQKFEKFCMDLGVIAKVGGRDRISTYDYISCHTNSKDPVLNSELMKNIKKGCIITTFVSSPGSREIDDSFYTDRANVVIDWEKNMFRAHEISSMVEKGELNKENIITLRDLLEGKRNLEDKDFTVFRFLGTPMQNLAVLKILLGE